MSLTSTSNRVIATGDNVTVLFNYTRLLYDATHLQVYLAAVLQTSGYTVNGVPGTSTSVTFTTPPGTGVQVLLLRVVPLTQLSVYAVGGAFPAATTEKNFDLAVMGLQQFDETLNRAVTLPVESTLTAANFPDPADPLNYGLGLKIATDGSGIDTFSLSANPFTSPLTTKGDLAVFSTVADRLAVGSNQAIIQADSAVAQGMKWSNSYNAILSTVASATTPDIFAITVGNTVNYTGTATATGLTAAPQAGAQRTLVCAGAAVFTAGANMLIDGLVSGQTYTAAAGDKVLVIAVTTTQFRLTPMKKNGQAIGTPIAQFGKAIYGLTYDNGTDATNDLNINTGGCMDATGAYWMTLATALGKQSDVNWAVGGTTGTPVGGLDTGAVGNSDYYIWLIARSDTGVVDALYSLSSTAPTMPTNYDFKRLMGWFKRVGGTIVLFHSYETEGGGLHVTWDVPTLDINLAATLTTTRRTDAVKVPLNFSVVVELNVMFSDAVGANFIHVCSPDQTDAAPSTTAAPLANVGSCETNIANTPVLGLLHIRTSSAGLVAARGSVATIDNYRVVTVGFFWARRN